jgi:hypothetical protein
MNGIDNKTKTLILLPWAIITLLAVAANYINFKSGHTDAERFVLDFTSMDLKIKEKQKVRITRALKEVFDFSSSEAIPNGLMSDSLEPQTDNIEARLSLIVINDKNKAAVINGTLIKEGDRIDDKKVVTIEKNRVLLKSSFAKWIYMEKQK